MGYFFRKSIKLGPVRVNLSKSGVGVSAGMKGFRVGVGPGGKPYVNASGYGVSYRKQLGGQGSSKKTTRKSAAERDDAQRNDAPPESSTAPEYPAPGATAEAHFPAASAAQLGGISPSELADLLRDSYAKWRLDYLVGAVGAALALAALLISWRWAIVVAVIAIAAFVAAAVWETRRRTVRLTYGLESAAGLGFQDFLLAFNHLAGSSHVWAISGGQLQRRTAAAVGEGLPPWVECNVPIPLLRIAGQTLYFFPDGILAYDASGVAHVPYTQLTVEVGAEQVTLPQAPRDATVVGQAWTHANKDGGPDRRFKNNPQLPVCEVGTLALRLPTAMLVELHTSQREAAGSFAAALETIAALAATEEGAGLKPWVEAYEAPVM